MIDTEKDNKKLVEKAFLVGVQDLSMKDSEAREHLAELKELVTTLGVPVVDKAMVRLREPHPKYLMGSGKAAEIVAQAAERSADCLVFDCDLSPSQLRNWEKLSKICVIDRQEVILDIFASRASTKEASLQVELARLEYLLPRLTRAWTHLSRQKGGVAGTRGEGEKQIEVDRRILQSRIAQLKKDLVEVGKRRGIQRRSRKRNEMPTGAIVGYTNAGKSSLLNALTGAGAYVEDKLFATLDPTTRKLELPDKSCALLTDTVGFVRKLPHSLVEAFKSTLEEAALADFLVIVLDISSVYAEEHWLTTCSVLKELDAFDRRKIVVFNKCDLPYDRVKAAALSALCPDKILTSTVTGEGLDRLRDEISDIIREKLQTTLLSIPPGRHDLVSLAHSKGRVSGLEYADDGSAMVRVALDKSALAKFKDFVVPG